MPLDSVFSVTMKTTNLAVGQAGFGTPMLVAYHTFWPERVKTFSELSELVTAGVPVTHPIYKMAQAVKLSDPAPARFKVGKRAQTANVQTVRITPNSPILGSVLSFTVSVNGLLPVAVSYTYDSTPTVAEAVIALQALFDAPVGIAATKDAGSTYVEITTDTAGSVIDLQTLSPAFVTVEDKSTDPGIATDLAAIYAADPDFYYVAIDRQSKAELVAAAAWVEANKKILVASTGDSACKASTAGNVALTLQASTYLRTLLDFSDAPGTYPSLAIAGKQAPKSPGSSNWAWKVVAGAFSSVLSTSEITALEAANCNYFAVLNSVTSYFWGKSAGGEWIDVTIGSDWFKQRLMERMHALMINSEKVDFTDDGILLIANQVLAQFKDAHTAGVTDPSVPVVLTVPTIADHSSQDFAARKIKPIKAKGRLRGAVNRADFEITIFQ